MKLINESKLTCIVSPGLPVRVNDIHEVRVGGVEPRLGGDVEPVEGVGHVAGEHRPIRDEHCGAVT